MSDDVEVTERGEIVVRTVDGDIRVFPHDGGYRLAAADRRPMRLTHAGLLAFCRRVIAEVDPDPDPVPTVDWSERDATIARQLGCSREAVRKMRARMVAP